MPGIIISDTALFMQQALVVPGRAPLSWAYGWVEHQGNCLSVTSNLGASILPLGFNQGPAWAMLTLIGESTRPMGNFSHR